MSWKVLVTARAFWVSGERARQALQEAGCEVVNSPDAGPLTEDVLIPLLRGCRAIIGSSDAYSERLFASAPDLYVVSRCGVGIDSVDLPAATAAGIVVTNTPGAMTDAVADYAFGLMLAAARRIPEGDALMRSGGWGEYPGTLVCGKTLGVIGLGAIGRGVAMRSTGFGMRVLGYDPPLRATGRIPADIAHVEMTDLDRLLAESDFISIHAPSTHETRGLIGREAIARMKRTAYIINTARGPLVDEPALLEALHDGRIAGAALDVYEREPLPADSPLRSAPRLVLTPHNAFNAVESVQEMTLESALNVTEIMQGSRPINTCNPDVWTGAGLRLGR